MSQGKAESIIIVAALIVGGLWAYQQYQTGGQNIDFTKFATAWGAVFLVLAIVAMWTPSLAAAFAMLVVVGDLLVNGAKLIGGVTAAENQTVTSGKQITSGTKNVQATHSFDPLASVNIPTPAVQTPAVGFTTPGAGGRVGLT